MLLQTGVETTNVKMSMNPFCEIALEEALRIKEAGIASEVVVVSMGSEKCTDVLRTGLAMGADRGIHVASDLPLHPMSVAKLLRALAVSEKPGLLLLGKQVWFLHRLPRCQHNKNSSFFLGWSSKCGFILNRFSNKNTIHLSLKQKIKILLMP